MNKTYDGPPSGGFQETDRRECEFNCEKSFLKLSKYWLSESVSENWF